MTCRGAVIAAAILTLAVACSRDPPHPPAVATRVVSLGPATTEALFAIGAGDRVVGRSRYSDWPPEVTKVPAVGGIEPDVEGILQLHPDLVVGPSGAWSAHLRETLDARGIASWFPDEIRSLAGVDALLVDLGSRTGHADDARREAARIDAGEAAVDRALASVKATRALLVVAREPVVVAGPGTFADEMLRHAGAVNVVSSGPAWPKVGFEQVVELDPDTIIDASLTEGEGSTQITPVAPGWGGVRAVRDGHVVPASDPRVLRPGPRIAEGLAVLARALHPEAMRSVPVPAVP